MDIKKIDKAIKNYFICSLCVALIMGIMIACYFYALSCYNYEGYTGKYPELFSVAIDSIPDCQGCMAGGEITHQPIVALIETDNYGRKLFVYSEGRDLTDKYGRTYDKRMIYLLICQSSDDDSAYYYKDACVTSTYISNFKKRVHYGGTGYGSTINDPISDFSNEAIAMLKQNNDWDIPLDLTDCAQTEIIRIVKNATY